METENRTQVLLATSMYASKTKVGTNQVRMANSLLAFQLTDDQLMRIDAIINCNDEDGTLCKICDRPTQFGMTKCPACSE